MRSVLCLTTATTGWNPKTAQLLELTAIRLEQLRETSRFHARVRWEPLAGDSECIRDHVRNGLIQECEEYGQDRDTVGAAFGLWLGNQYPDGGPVSVCCYEGWRTGLNFVVTDLKIDVLAFHPRVLEPGSLWVTPDDFQLPGVIESCRRAGIDYKETYRSTPGCEALVKLLQKWGSESC